MLILPKKSLKVEQKLKKHLTHWKKMYKMRSENDLVNLTSKI